MMIMKPARLIIVAAFAALALVVTAGPATAVEVVRVISPGGIEAWLVEEHGIPILSLRAVFRDGAVLDPAGLEGRAYMASGLLDEGAGAYDSLAFQGRLEDLAIHLSFDAGFDSFSVNLKTLSENRDAAFEMLGLAMTEPRFDEEPVERIRSQIQVQLARATGPGEAALDEITLRLTGGGIALESATGTASIAAAPLGGALWQVRDGSGARQVHLHEGSGAVTLVRDGGRLTFALSDPMAGSQETGHGGDSITAPLPGIVKSLNVSPGATVAAGDVLAVMEAMKMEHSLLAPRNGTVAEVAVRAGEQVEEGALLITLEPEA